jgi:hypothetical protein
MKQMSHTKKLNSSRVLFGYYFFIYEFHNSCHEHHIISGVKSLFDCILFRKKQQNSTGILKGKIFHKIAL